MKRPHRVSAIIFTTALCLTAGISNARKYEPTKESLVSKYKDPEWFRDAKFGIYTHWGPVTYAIRHNTKDPMGWYGRQRYIKDSEAQQYHKKHYGDPGVSGYGLTERLRSNMRG